MSILLCYLVFYRSANVSFIPLLKFFTFTANIDYLDTIPFQSPLVILSTEMQFYLLAPIFYLLLRKLLQWFHIGIVGMLIVLSGIVIRYGAYQLGMTADWHMYMEHIYVTVFGMLDQFLFGMFISYIVLEKMDRISTVVYSVPKWLVGMIVLLSLGWVNYTNDSFATWNEFLFIQMYLLPLVTSTLIGFFILRTTSTFSYSRQESIQTILQTLTHFSQWVYGIGALSYGIYMYHFICVDLVTRVIPNTQDMRIFLFRYILVFLLSLLMAFCSYVLIEYPLLRRNTTKKQFI